MGIPLPATFPDDWPNVCIFENTVFVNAAAAVKVGAK
jgi:hypothetical protein